MSEWSDDYVGWGRNLAVRHRIARPRDTREARAALLARGTDKVLARGCGRSYGDVALNPDGLLIDCTALDRFVRFDNVTGQLACEAGVRIADILALICRPEENGGGWFLPVSPGTRYVTVAGAIANDVHGKNHHVFGSFGHHVLEVELALSDGRVVCCSPAEKPELFRATIGGLGLTGLILRAVIQMRRVEGLAVEAEDIRFDRLEDFFALSTESDGSWEYTAAWIDCLAQGKETGRGIFSRARHIPGHAAEPPSAEPSLNVPVTAPVSAVSRRSVSAFNALHWRRVRGKARTRQGSYAGILYPLDAIGHWNRLYGPKGFFQFQNVLPVGKAPDALRAILREVTATGEGSMLAVLKVFGDFPPPGLLSFPMAGATLALDLVNRGASTFKLLERLERITLEAGGRIYPAKDSLMSPEAFALGYDQIDRFKPWMDPAFTSGLARRVRLHP